MSAFSCVAALASAFAFVVAASAMQVYVGQNLELLYSSANILQYYNRVICYLGCNLLL